MENISNHGSNRASSKVFQKMTIKHSQVAHMKSDSIMCATVRIDENNIPSILLQPAKSRFVNNHCLQSVPVSMKKTSQGEYVPQCPYLLEMFDKSPRSTNINAEGSLRLNTQPPETDKTIYQVISTRLTVQVKILGEI